MAFDIQPPKRSQSAVRRFNVAPRVEIPKKKINSPKTKAASFARPVRESVSKIKPVKRKKVKVKRAGRWGLFFTWLVLFLVLGVVGYLIWQEENNNASLEKGVTAPAGIIETFPSPKNVSNNKEADGTNKSSVNKNSDKEFVAAEQDFSQELEKLKAQDFTPPSYNRSEWEQINSYLSDF